jgi:hypothetical protein
LPLVALVALGTAPPARAGTSYEYLFNAKRVSNDSQYYLNLAVRSYNYPRADIEPALPHLHRVESELPVILLVAHASGRPVGFISSLRGQGLSWATVFERVHVPCDILFRGIDKDPGPPYGKAWGSWRAKSYRFTDDEIVGLANVQTARRVTGMSAYAVAHARGEGKTVAAIVADKKGRHRAALAAGATTSATTEASGACTAPRAER